MVECLPFLFILSLAVSGAPDLRDIIYRLEARYRSAATMQAAFLERYSEDGRVVRVEAGTVYFRRPGKMRWEYESPEKNLFLVDGKTAWFYVPADHTVTRVPAKESTDWRTPLALLAGEMKVSRVCARVELAQDEKPETPEDALLFCELRGVRSQRQKRGSPDGSSQNGEAGEAVFFEIARDSGDLVRVLVRDPGGVLIEFRFSNWRMDAPAADSLFRFTVPAGVAIVNGELPGSQNPVNP